MSLETSLCFFFLKCFLLLFVIIIHYFPFSFPLSRQSPIPLLAVFQIHAFFSLIAVKYIYVYVDTNIFINIVCSVCMMLLVCMFSVLNIWYLITIGVLFLSWGKPILSTFSTVLIHFLFHPPCFGLIQYKQLICWLSNKKKVVNLSIG